MILLFGDKNAVSTFYNKLELTFCNYWSNENNRPLVIVYAYNDVSTINLDIFRLFKYDFILHISNLNNNMSNSIDVVDMIIKFYIKDLYNKFYDTSYIDDNYYVDIIDDIYDINFYIFKSYNQISYDQISYNQISYNHIQYKYTNFNLTNSNIIGIIANTSKIASSIFFIKYYQI